jgi:hypothetical protein
LTMLLSKGAMKDAMHAIKSTIHLFEVILQPERRGRYNRSTPVVAESRPRKT